MNFIPARIAPHKMTSNSCKTQLYFQQQWGRVGTRVICGNFAFHKQAFLWMGVSQQQLLLFSDCGLLQNKGTQTGWRTEVVNWTTLHENFLGAPTLLLGSSSKIQKQFKMKANFFQNLKALSYSESCPPVGCLYQYIEKGKNLSLCANYRFSGDEQNT